MGIKKVQIYYPRLEQLFTFRYESEVDRVLLQEYLLSRECFRETELDEFERGYAVQQITYHAFNGKNVV